MQGNGPGGMSKPASPSPHKQHQKRARVRAQKRGRWAERLAAWTLRLTGHRILAQNFKTQVGEIDLIAKRGRLIRFIEVKARTDHADAADAVGPQQRRRVQRAAEAFLMQRPLLHVCDIRFDVCLVSGPGRLTFVKDAWRP